MDKEEFRVKLEEINHLVEMKDYKGAMNVVDSIDWRRVKNVRTLCVVGEIYAANKRYEDSKEIFLLAYHRSSIGKNILYRLIEVSLKMGDIDEAMEYFEEYMEVAPNDNAVYILKYKIYKAKKASLEELIQILEEYKEKEFTEKWSYELADLYYQAGEKEKCLDLCNQMVIWFSDGKYVMKALELKLRLGSLTGAEKEMYEKQFVPNLMTPDEVKNLKESQVPGENQTEESSVKPAVEEEGLKIESIRMDEKDINNAESLQEKISKGIRDIFNGGKKKEKEEEIFEETESPAEEENVQEEMIRNISSKLDYVDVPDLEPEEEDIVRAEKKVLTESDEEDKADLSQTIKMPELKIPKSMKNFSSENTGKEDLAVPETEKSINLDMMNFNLEDTILAAATAQGIEIPDEPVQESVEKQHAALEDVQEEERNPEEGISQVEEPAAEEFAGWEEEEQDAEEEIAPVKESVEEPAALQEEKKVPEEKAPVKEKKVKVKKSARPVRISYQEMEDDFMDEESEDVDVDFEEPLEDFDDFEDVEEDMTSVPVNKNIPTLEEEDFLSEEDLREAEEEFLNGPSPKAKKAPLKSHRPEGMNTEMFNFQEEIKKVLGDKDDILGDGTFEEDTPVMSSKFFMDDDSEIEEVETEEPEFGEEEQEEPEPLTEEEELEQFIESIQPKNKRSPYDIVPREHELTDDEKKLFTYFVRVPGMKEQLIDTLCDVQMAAADKTSRTGNVIVMGGRETGKTRLISSLIPAICKELNLEASKVAYVFAEQINGKDISRIVSKLAGGFLVIENANQLTPETAEQLNKAMEFRTDGLTVIVEDEKIGMRKFIARYPKLAKKFTSMINIPVFTNDELVAFAKVYTKENGYTIDQMGMLALYNLISENQKEDEAMNIGTVKNLIDNAIAKSQGGIRKFQRNISKKRTDHDGYIVLYEKDFS